MARITTNTNNQLSGRLGNLVYYQLNGKTFVRSLPEKVKNPKTPLQQLNRQRFATVGQLFQIFRPALRFDIKKKSTNKYCLFYTLNSPKVSVSEAGIHIQYEQLILNNASVTDLIGLEITKGANQVSFQWKQDSLQGNDYYVLCAVFCKGLQRVYVSDVPRNSFFAQVYVPEGAGELVTYAYTYWRK